jgi:serine/threonine protein kinase
VRDKAGGQAEGEGDICAAGERVQHPAGTGRLGGIQDHPNIIKIFGMYEDAKNYYIVSELIRGRELFEYFKQKKRLTEK